MDERASGSTSVYESARVGCRVLSRRDLLAMAGGGGMIAAVGSGVRAETGPTVRLDFTADEIDVGETTDVTVSISEIPDGLSGLLGDAGVSDVAVATVTDATVNQEFGLIQDIELAADGSMVNLVAADINRVFEEGETDIELFTLELTATGAGETEVVIEDMIEAGDGSFYEFEVVGSVLTVRGDEDSDHPEGGPADDDGESEDDLGDDSEGDSDDSSNEGDDGDSDTGSGSDDDSSDNGGSVDDSSNDGETGDGDDDASALPGFGAGTAVAGLVGGIAYAVRNRIRGTNESQ